MAEISKYEEENILGADTANLTLWKAHKSMIETRPQGWLKRFAVKVDDAILLDPPRTHSEQREDRMRATGWEPIVKTLPTKPPRFKVDKLHEISEWKGPSDNLCYLCWGMVPSGPAKVCCTKCPAVSHHYCVVDASRYRLPVVSSTRVNISLQREVLDHKVCVNESGVICNWICPACIQEVQLRNNVCERDYQAKRKIYSQEYAAIKIQSFARMVRPKADFNRIILGVLILQRTLRARRFWRKAEGEKSSALLKPFRVRIHSICVIINVDGNDAVETPLDETTGKFVKPYHNIIGEMSANAFAELMKSDHSETTPSAQSVPVPSVGASTAGSSAIVLPALPLAQPQSSVLESVASEDMLSLLRIGHIEVPSFMQPFKLPPGKVVNRGSYFLTISVQRARKLRDADSNYEDTKQLYRIDTQLKLDGAPMRLSPGLLKRIGIEMDSAGCEALGHLRIQRFSLARPYILFPASDSCVVLKLVVSQTYTVAEIFKTAVVGLAVIPINTNIIWRRNLSANTGLCGVDTYDDLPTAEDGCRIDLHPHRPSAFSLGSQNSIASSSNAAAKKSLHESLVRNVDNAQAIPAKLKLSEEERLGQPVGAIVTWSLLTVSFDLGDHAGEVFMLSQPFVQSSKRRQWLTLIDRVVRIYPTAGDMLPNLILDLRSTHVVPLDNGIIRVKYRLETWFLYFSKPADGLEWLRISNEVRKYSDAMIVPRRMATAGASNGPGTVNASKASHGVSWEDYLGDLLHEVCVGLGDDYSTSAADDEATISSAHTARSPRGASSGAATSRSTPATARRTGNTPSTGSSTARSPSRNLSSSTPTLPALTISVDETDQAEGANRNRKRSPKNPKPSNKSQSQRLSSPNISPAPELHASNFPSAVTRDSADELIKPALPPLKPRTVKGLSKRENMMLHVLAQAAKQFKA